MAILGVDLVAASTYLYFARDFKALKHVIFTMIFAYSRPYMYICLCA